MSALGQKRTYAVQQNTSLNHLVGAQQYGRRKRDAERLGGLQVNNDVEFGCALDRQVTGLRALEKFCR